LILLAAGVGLIRLSLGNWRFALLILLGLAANLVYVATHDMGDIQVAYIPTYIVLALCAATAMGVRSPDQDSNTTTRARWWERGIALALLSAVLLPAFRDGAWTPEGRRAVWVPEGEPPFRVAYSEKLKRDVTVLVKSLEDDAIVLTDWDLLYPCYYVAHVEQRRTGMIFIQIYPAIGQSELAESAREFLREKLLHHPIYVLEPLPELADEVRFEPILSGEWTIFRMHPRQNLPDQ
jgi:hypothetical protein